MTKDRQKVFDKYGGKCAYCGCELEIKKMQVDHLICQRNFEWHIKNKYKVPDFLSHLTVWDLNHIDNLMPSCRSCNNFKTTFDIEYFRNEISEQINRLKAHKPTFNLAERFGLITCNRKPVVFYFETIKK